MEDETVNTLKSGSNGIWQSLISNAGSILGGISSVVQAGTGKYPDTYIIEEKDNTGKYLAIGGAVIVLVVILVMVFKK
jgi:hypothetical protein